MCMSSWDFPLLWTASCSLSRVLLNWEQTVTIHRMTVQYGRCITAQTSVALTTAKTTMNQHSAEWTWQVKTFLHEVLSADSGSLSWRPQGTSERPKTGSLWGGPLRHMSDMHITLSGYLRDNLERQIGFQRFSLKIAQSMGCPATSGYFYTPDVMHRECHGTKLMKWVEIIATSFHLRNLKMISVQISGCGERTINAVFLQAWRYICVLGLMPPDSWVTVITHEALKQWAYSGQPNS